MRCLSPLAYGLPLMMGTMLACTPVLAQTAETMTPAPAVVVTLPATDTTLAIPTPPGAKLRVEMDARSEDLLGLMKSFLKGIGETGTAATPAATGQPPADADLVAQLLEGNKLSEMLKDVNHVHFTVWELPAPPTPPVTALDPKSKIKVLPPVVVPPPVPAFDSSAFYEDAFSREGAHRLLYTDADVYKLVMVGFPNRQGFAFAVSGAGYVAVSRSDGYPNLEVLSSFISRVTSAALKSKTGKDMIGITMGGDKGADKPDDKK